MSFATILKISLAVSASTQGKSLLKHWHRYRDWEATSIISQVKFKTLPGEEWDLRASFEIHFFLLKHKIQVTYS